ncbi:MAG: DUF3592 domain-containing protein [Pseudomonadota bacterium]
MSCNSQTRIFNMPFRMAVALFMVPLLLFMSAWILIVRMPVQEALEARGVTTVAVVEAVSTYRDPRPTRGGRREVVTYRFTTANGQVFTSTLKRSYNYNRPVTVGRRIDVTYLPEDPDAHFTSLHPYYTREAVAYLLLPIALLLLGIGAYESRRLPREWEGPRLWPPIRLR